MSKRYLLGGAALVAVALLPLTVRRDDVVWELVQLAGYLSAIGCLILTGATLRPRDAQPSRLLTLTQHKWLAWSTVALLSVHVAGALLVDRHTLEYLKPSLPIYQLAGIVATAALAVMSITALSRVRRSLWRNGPSFFAVHLVLATVVVLFTFVHVVATDRYAAGPKRWLWAALTILVLLLPLQRAPRIPVPSRWPLAFRQYAKRISLALGLAALACLGLAAQKHERRAQLTLETFAPRAQPLPVEFPHELHGSVDCIACHHNFIDGTGNDSCIPCHRSERQDLQLGAEARFHTFCMECHREGAPATNDPDKHGPVSRCSACHRPLRQGSRDLDASRREPQSRDDLRAILQHFELEAILRKERVHQVEPALRTGPFR